MHLAHVDHEIDWLADPYAGARIEPADHFLAAVLDIRVHLAAEWLDHGDIRVELGRLVHAARYKMRVVNVLGANAKVDRLTDMVAERVQLFGGQRQREGADINDRAAILAIELGLEEVHRRRA